MSGILGLFNLNGAPVADADLRAMAGALARRGPEGSSVWRSAANGLGHTLLATTAEAQSESLPLTHDISGCVITADARIDNRQELFESLELAGRAGSMGDGALILSAYLAWDEACVDHLLGDFAFALWDPRKQRLFCARDHLGMRPFYYHYSAGRLCAFASEPGAILLLRQIPYRLNEGRIADFLVNPLEGIDKTSTFFQDVVRLPPAHTLAATCDGMKLRRYWQPRAGPELRLRSDDAYAEAFLAVFTRAVQCRLRAPEAPGSMLSGGIDSGSVVAVARTLLAEAGKGPLHTFSATGSDPRACIETRTIVAAQTMSGITPHTVSHGRMRSLVPALWPLTWGLDEPFDNHMTLQRVVYLDARNCGRKVVLDGVGGDIVLSGGPRIARLLREGRWVAAYREARGTNLYFGRKHLPIVDLYQGARSAFMPQWLRDVRRRCDLSYERRHLAGKMRESVISPEFAKRVGLAERLRALDAHQPPGLTAADREGLAAEIDHPFLTVGRERYDRVASAVSIEPRDPFLDLRVVEFCLTLPAAQRQRDGWPKVILRHAMAGRLSEAVRWRRGKEHLGGEFTRAFMDAAREAIRVDMEKNQSTIASYVDLDAVGRASRSYYCSGDPAQAERFYDAAHLASWLRRFGERPSPAMRRSTGREGIPDQHEARKT